MTLHADDLARTLKGHNLRSPSASAYAWRGKSTERAASGRTGATSIIDRGRTALQFLLGDCGAKVLDRQLETGIRARFKVGKGIQNNFIGCIRLTETKTIMPSISSAVAVAGRLASSAVTCAAAAVLLGNLAFRQRLGCSGLTADPPCAAKVQAGVANNQIVAPTEARSLMLQVIGLLLTYDCHDPFETTTKRVIKNTFHQRAAYHRGAPANLGAIL